LHSLKIILDILLYKSLFTVLPQCISAEFDEHIPAERALHEPHLYQYITLTQGTRSGEVKSPAEYTRRCLIEQLSPIAGIEAID